MSNANASMMGFGRGMGGGVSDTDLATALGIDVTKLKAAYQSATAEALKQAVAKGLITQAQADAFTARGELLRGEGGAGWLSANGIDYNSLLANALGISVDKLQAAYLQAFNTSVDAAVKNGTMTQTQADQILKSQSGSGFPGLGGRVVLRASAVVAGLAAMDLWVAMPRPIRIIQPTHPHPQLHLQPPRAAAHS